MRRNLLREPFTDIENRHGLSTHLTWGSVISPHSVGRRPSADTHTDPPHDHIELQQSLRATLHLVVRTRAPGLHDRAPVPARECPVDLVRYRVRKLSCPQRAVPKLPERPADLHGQG